MKFMKCSNFNWKSKGSLIVSGLSMTTLLLSGCARFHTAQIKQELGPQGNVTSQVTTKATAYTFFTSKSQLTNWKATQTEKSQGASVGQLVQESNTTNEMAVIQAVVQAAIQAVTKAPTIP
jgi:hypothetical protein